MASCTPPDVCAGCARLHAAHALSVCPRHMRQRAQSCIQVSTHADHKTSAPARQGAYLRQELLLRERPVLCLHLLLARPLLRAQATSLDHPSSDLLSILHTEIKPEVKPEVLTIFFCSRGLQG